MSKKPMNIVEFLLSTITDVEEILDAYRRIPHETAQQRFNRLGKYERDNGLSMSASRECAFLDWKLEMRSSEIAEQVRSMK
jgi:hypothetical protein